MSIRPMRVARLLAQPDRTGYYHCMSRVVDRRFIFESEEKEFLVKTLRKVAIYHGLRVLTYCAMGNHFHVLVEVPGKEVRAEPNAEEILRRVGALYGGAGRNELEQQLDRARKQGDVRWEEEILDRHRAGMGELRNFMKMLKQRFTMWYNRRKGRKGTLWEERYKSVLVEGSCGALLACAAYIDLNPVRASIVEDPKDYRWSGYGAAVSGVKTARKGIGAIFESTGTDPGWRSAGKEYRKYVFRATEPQPDSGSKVAGVLNPTKVREVVSQGGALSLEEVLRVRVRYFTDGMALGSREFVNEVFEANRSRFSLRRKSGARPMRGADWGGLSVIRDLRLDVFG